MSNPKLNFKEETSAQKTRSPPKKARVEQSTPKKKKLKLDADKAAEKNQHLRFGKAELTPDELSRLSKAQKREMYAANAARTAVHREIDQYEDDNVGVQALSEGEKAAGNVRDVSKSRYARKLKKKAKMQGKKGAKTAKIFCTEPNCGTRCRSVQHRRGRFQLAFTLETAARNPQKLLCRRPFGHGGADRRRQSGIQRCICRPVQHGTGGRKGQNCRQHCRERAGECRKEQRTRSGDRGRFCFAHPHGHVWFFLLRHPLFGRHTGVRADHVFCRGQGHPGRRTGLQEAGKGTG